MMDRWTASVLRVGDGRGFVIHKGHYRYVLTGAHCLPELPPAAAHAGDFDLQLLSRLGDPHSIWGTVVFVDPVADIAILSAVDGQERYDEAEAFETLTESVEPFPLVPINEWQRQSITHPGTGPFSCTSYGPPYRNVSVWMLSLDGAWFAARAIVKPRGIWIENASQPIRSGMSGSPIICESGAIGILCTSFGGIDHDTHTEGGPNPYLFGALPGWFLDDPKPTTASLP